MRVLIVEDSERLRASLERGLTREGFSVDSADDGADALVLARANPFDLIVLDLMLPTMHGLDVLRELRRSGCDVPVLILTAKDTTEDVVEGFEAGSDDYLVKPFAFEELVVRCRSLIQRHYGKRGQAVRVGPLAFDANSRRLMIDDEPVDLAARDLKVLEYLAARAGEIVTREELEDHVYRTSDLPQSNAIDSAICALRRKIDRRVDAGSFIRTVRGVGYVLEAPRP